MAPSQYLGSRSVKFTGFHLRQCLYLSKCLAATTLLESIKRIQFEDRLRQLRCCTGVFNHIVKTCGQWPVIENYEMCVAYKIQHAVVSCEKEP